MVRYAVERGLSVQVVDGPSDIGGSRRDVVLCLSVFTHIPRDDRVAYLEAFRGTADRLLVDILPAASEDGSFDAWYTHPVNFESDLIRTGWSMFDSYDRTSGDGYLHRYYHCR